MTNVAPRGPDYEFQKLYFDTASATNAPAMAAILKLVPPSHVMFGRTFPGKRRKGPPRFGEYRSKRKRDSSHRVRKCASVVPSSQGIELNHGKVSKPARPVARRNSMAPIQFALNGKPQSVNVNPEMPLLWVLRDTLGMTGTKFGCGMALCGACTVHINGAAFRSCSTKISSVAGRR